MATTYLNNQSIQPRVTNLQARHSPPWPRRGVASLKICHPGLDTLVVQVCCCHSGRISTPRWASDFGFYKKLFAYRSIPAFPVRLTYGSRRKRPQHKEKSNGLKYGKKQSWRRCN